MLSFSLRDNGRWKTKFSLHVCNRANNLFWVNIAIAVRIYPFLTRSGWKIAHDIVGPPFWLPCWRLGCMACCHCAHLHSREILIFLLGWKMAHLCIAIGCSNRSARDSKRVISFHRLPLKDKGLLSKWLAQIKRENLPQMKHCHVCSEHFEPTCFESG